MIHSTTTPSSEYITDDGLQVVCHRIHALYVLVVTPTSHNAFTAAAYLQHTVRFGYPQQPCVFGQAHDDDALHTDRRTWVGAR